MSFLSCIFVKFDFIYFSGRSSSVILVNLGTRSCISYELFPNFWPGRITMSSNRGLTTK